MMQDKPHPQSELLRAIADGKQIQICTRNAIAQMLGSTHWEDFSEREVLQVIASGEDFHWRVKPESKPDIIRYMFVEPTPKLDNAFNPSNLKLTFDGETHKLKAVEILR